MATKPTYEALVERVRELEDQMARLKTADDQCSRDVAQYQEIEAMALLGH